MAVILANFFITAHYLRDIEFGTAPEFKNVFISKSSNLE